MAVLAAIRCESSMVADFEREFAFLCIAFDRGVVKYEKIRAVNQPMLKTGVEMPATTTRCTVANRGDMR